MNFQSSWPSGPAQLYGPLQYKRKCEQDCLYKLSLPRITAVTAIAKIQLAEEDQNIFDAIEAS